MHCATIIVVINIQSNFDLIYLSDTLIAWLDWILDIPLSHENIFSRQRIISHHHPRVQFPMEIGNPLALLFPDTSRENKIVNSGFKYNKIALFHKLVSFLVKPENLLFDLVYLVWIIGIVLILNFFMYIIFLWCTLLLFVQKIYSSKRDSLYDLAYARLWNVVVIQ